MKYHLISTLFVTFYMINARPAQSAIRHYLGCIDKIHGQVWFRSATNSNGLSLDSTKHRFLYLFNGDSVRCAQDSFVTILYLSGQTTNLNAISWTTIPSISDSAGMEAFSASARFKALGPKTSSRKMHGGPRELFHPADGSTQLPTNQLVQWNPTTKGSRFRLQLEDVLGVPRWTSDGWIDGNLGFYIIPDLPATLQRIRGSRKIILQQIFEEGDDQKVEFTLLIDSRLVEFESLRSEITKIADPTDRLLALAGLYVEYGLQNDAAHAYDQLVELPLLKENQVLLDRTLQQHELVGNRLRVEAIRKRLQALTFAP